MYKISDRRIRPCDHGEAAASREVGLVYAIERRGDVAGERQIGARPLRRVGRLRPVVTATPSVVARLGSSRRRRRRFSVKLLGHWRSPEVAASLDRACAEGRGTLASTEDRRQTDRRRVTPAGHTYTPVHRALPATRKLPRRARRFVALGRSS